MMNKPILHVKTSFLVEFSWDEGGDEDLRTFFEAIENGNY